LHQRGLRLVAPHLLDSEVVNALRRLVLQRQLTDDEGAAALDLFGAMEIVRYPADWLRGGCGLCGATSLVKMPPT
jgi:predicted nucleic acid-binding protein